MEQDLMAYLLAHPGLAVLVGEEIYWDLAPQETPTPYVVLTTIAARTDYTYEGRSKLAAHLVQWDVYADLKAQANAVRDQLVAATSGLPSGALRGAFITDRRSGLDTGAGRQGDLAATPLHRASLDVRVWHREP